MSDRRSGSGQIAWCTSGAIAMATHILLLWSTPPAAPTRTTAAAAQIEWELLQSPKHAESAATPLQPVAAESDARSSTVPSPSASPSPTKHKTAGRPVERARLATKTSIHESRPAPSAAAPSDIAPESNGVLPIPNLDPSPSPSPTTHKAAGRPVERAQLATKTSIHESRPAPSASVSDIAPESNGLPFRSSGAAAISGDDSARTLLAAGVRDVSTLSDVAAARADVPALRGAAAISGDARTRLAAGSGGVAGATPAPRAVPSVRGPLLLATRDPCAGYFPGSAAAKRGEVQLALDVDPEGHARAREILLESPRGQGFESAAKACADQLHFAPALDAQGHPVSGHARIALRFERS